MRHKAVVIVAILCSIVLLVSAQDHQQEGLLSFARAANRPSVVGRSLLYGQLGTFQKARPSEMNGTQAAQQNDSETVELKSNAEAGPSQTFWLTPEQAFRSKTIKNLIDDTNDGEISDTPILLKDIDASTLELIVGFLKKENWYESSPDAEDKQLDHMKLLDRAVLDIEVMRLSPVQIVKLLCAVNYLDIELLLDVLSKYIAQHITEFLKVVSNNEHGDSQHYFSIYLVDAIAQAIGFLSLPDELLTRIAFYTQTILREADLNRVDFYDVLPNGELRPMRYGMSMFLNKPLSLNDLSAGRGHWKFDKLLRYAIINNNSVSAFSPKFGKPQRGWIDILSGWLEGLKNWMISRNK